MQDGERGEGFVPLNGNSLTLAESDKIVMPTPFVLNPSTVQITEE